MDHPEVFEVFRGKKPIAFFVFSGLQNIKLPFPITDHGCIHMEHPGNFANGIVQFLGSEGIRHVLFRNFIEDRIFSQVTELDVATTQS